jgi:transposase-like protein
MLLIQSISGLFKWRQFEPEVILLAVGWYLRFSLSYREVEELLAERCLLVDHVTVWRWVQRYTPELQRRLRRHLKPTNDSWRVDETYVRVKGKWRYLYRAVDSTPICRASLHWTRNFSAHELKMCWPSFRQQLSTKSTRLQKR